MRIASDNAFGLTCRQWLSSLFSLLFCFHFHWLGLVEKKDQPRSQRTEHKLKILILRGDF